MAIKRAELNDILVFKGEFTTEFYPGVNILIGSNGTGKTTLLKTMYGSINGKLEKCFYLPEEKDTVVFKKSNTRIFFDDGTCTDFQQEYYNESTGIPKNSTSGTSISLQATLRKKKDIQSVFIPEKDMLSHSFGFLALKHERPMIPFDDTLTDIIAKAQLYPKEGTLSNPLCATIRDIIGGEVVYDNDTFIIIKDKDKAHVPFPIEASGYRKLGLLWKLIRNGFLEPGAILFWDEPENSLNPELVPLLVDILLELAQSEVQVFIATHDYYLARYFDVRKNKSVPVMFHNLSKTDDGQIVCNSSAEYVKISNNHLESASADLFRAVVADAMEVADDE